MKVELKIIDQRIERVEYGTPGAAAVDLRACSIIDGGLCFQLTSRYELAPGERVKIGTGIAIHVGSLELNGVPMCSKDISAAALLLPRSGTGWRGLELANTAGLIDADFTGEYILAVKNGGVEPLVIEPLERLAQMFIVPVFRPDFMHVEEFSSKTQRGDGSFGSTGSI